MLTREKEIAEAARKHCPANLIKVDYFAQGARWADEHPENKWRSVKDELPENREVLADVEFDTGYGLCHDYCIAHFDQIIGLWFTREKQPINVVNWMPLPELPKTEEQ